MTEIETKTKTNNSESTPSNSKLKCITGIRRKYRELNDDDGISDDLIQKSTPEQISNRKIYKSTASNSTLDSDANESRLSKETEKEETQLSKKLNLTGEIGELL